MALSDDLKAIEAQVAQDLGRVEDMNREYRTTEAPVMQEN